MTFYNVKLEQKVDKKVNQNEIESDCMWYLSSYREELILYRIHLPTLTICYFKAFSDRCSIRILQTLPNDQVYGLFSRSCAYYFQFMSDQNFKIKDIDSTALTSFTTRSINSCFYEDSIFAYETRRLATLDNIKRYFGRYLIAQNRWIPLLCMPAIYKSNSFSGINQKIVIVGDYQKLWVYDIILDSYSVLLPIGIQSKIGKKLLIKIEGKMYMMIFSDIIEVYYCYDPLSEWTCFCKRIEEALRYISENSYSSRALYEGFIYCIKDNCVYQFDLAQFKSKQVGKFNSQLSKIIKNF